MNWIDYAIIAVVAFGAVNGLRQGFIRQFFGIVGFAAGFVLASQHYQSLATYLSFVPDQNWASVAGFVIIVGFVMGIAAVIGKGLRGIADMMLFGCFDRWFGAAAGVLMSVLIIEVALIFLKKYPVFGSELFDAVLVQQLLNYAPVVLKLLPQEFGSIRLSAE